MSERSHGATAKLRQRAFARWGFVPRAPHFRWGKRARIPGHTPNSYWGRVRFTTLPASAVLVVVFVTRSLYHARIPVPRGALEWVLCVLALAGSVVLPAVAHALYWRILLRSTPRVYSALAVPTCYRCGFDLAGILTDDPRARVVCPECGFRQMRSLPPQGFDEEHERLLLAAWFDQPRRMVVPRPPRADRDQSGGGNQ